MGKALIPRFIQALNGFTADLPDPGKYIFIQFIHRQVSSPVFNPEVVFVIVDKPLDLALGLRPSDPAASGGKPIVACKTEQVFIDLPLFFGRAVDEGALHVVVQNLSRHSAEVLKSKNVTPEQCPLIHARCLNHKRSSRVTENHGKGVELLRFSIDELSIQYFPVDLSLKARLGFKADDRFYVYLCRLLSRVVSENTNPAVVLLFAKVSQKNFTIESRIVFEYSINVGFEGIEFAFVFPLFSPACRL